MKTSTITYVKNQSFKILKIPVTAKSADLEKHDANYVLH